MSKELARAASQLQSGGPLGLHSQAAEPSPDAGDAFARLLTGKVKEVNHMQLSADDLVHQLLTGEDVSQAEVLTAVQKADLAFRMMLQVRNKLIEAYRELQQIQI